MEPLTTLDIQNTVKEILETDTTLSQYVKKFDIGGNHGPRALFPYITVAEVTDNIYPLCMGTGAADLHNYTIVVQAGSYHTLPDFARNGNGVDSKGIVQLVDDIVAALFPGNINGVFANTVRLLEASVIDNAQSGGRSWTGTITLSGTRKF